jgi:hypothetical protein
MFMIKLIAIGGLALAMAAPQLDATAASAPASKITVDVVTIMGSGCPTGTAALAVSPDNTAFTVSYSQYIAEIGSGVALSDSRKNCQLSLLVHVPAGFTYAIAQADYRGFAELASGATGTQQGNYYFMGDSATASSSHVFAGPMSGDWQATDQVATASLVFSKCGVTRNLNVNSSIRVAKGTSGTRSSYMAMDSTDGSFSTLFHFAWRTC